MELIQLLCEDQKLLMKFCRLHKRNFIYGAGTLGQQIYRLLKLDNIKVDHFIVSIIEGNPQRIGNVDVMEIADAEMDKDTGVIVATEKKYWKEICENLVKKGLSKENIYCQHIWKKQLNYDFLDSSFYIKGRSTLCSAFFPQSHLSVLAKQAGTDKSAAGFLDKYDYFLQRYKKETISLMELGVFHGQSLRMWEDYFPMANIIGVDVNAECMKYQSERIRIIIANLGDPGEFKKLESIHPSIIIDDASHIWSHQILALVYLFPFLKNGGVYILEDIHTSFRATESFGCFNDTSVNAYEFCSAIGEVVTSGEHLDLHGKNYYLGILADEIEKIAVEVDMISFVRNSCILIKK